MFGHKIIRRAVATAVLSASALVALGGSASADSSWHRYLGNYPKARENGWAGEAQGVAHNSNSWFFTQRDRLLKFPRRFDLNRQVNCSSPPAGVICRPIPQLLRDQGYNHYGDLDRYGNYLFVPIEGSSRGPGIAVFRTSDLALLSWIRLYDAGGVRIVDRQSKNAGWLAISPGGQFLYSSNNHVTPNVTDQKGGPLFAYRLNMNRLAQTNSIGGGTLRFDHRLTLNDHSGTPMTFLHMQGGVFSPSGRLYLSHGNEADNVGGGIKVFTRGGEFIAKSENGRGTFNYEFHPGWDTYEEPEGLDWWDLRDASAPGILGNLHAIMLDNDSNGDDLYFKHYDVSRD